MRRITQTACTVRMDLICLLVEFMNIFRSHLGLSTRNYQRMAIDLQSCFPFLTLTGANRAEIL
jgi:hypothetical protein